MRLLPLIVLLLAACAQDPVSVPERSAEADELLAHVSGDAWDTAFAASPEARYLRRASGEAESEVDSIPNPLPAFLSDEPPYLDASARDQYATQVLGDTTIANIRARIVEARFIPDGRRTQPIRYVRAAVSPDSGVLLAIAIQREMTSTLFDETSELHAELASGARGLQPGSVSIEASTDVPLSPSRATRVTWEWSR